MQTPKSRPGSLELPQKKSSLPAPRTARRVKTDSDQKTKTIPKTQIPKLVADIRSSPRIPLNEIQKKRTGRIPELESQISELQEELKKVKEELNKSEALKKEAQKTTQQLNASEDSRIEELLKLSQERDKTWQNELEAMQRQHGLDSSALSSAIKEVQKLKSKLFESESESSMEVETMKEEIIKLKSAVDEAEKRHQEEYTREAELAEELKKTKAETEGLRKQVTDTEDLKRLELELIVARGNLNEKEMELQNLKKKVETTDTEAMETELRRVKIQCEQWRKAAETAVSILNSEERTDSIENVNMLKKFVVCATQETMMCPRLPRK